MPLKLGTRIFNHGDQANPPRWGRVVKVSSGANGLHYLIEPEPDPGDGPGDRSKYWIPAAMVSPEYLGHAGTRIVTEVAYRAWQIRSVKEATTIRVDLSLGEALYLSEALLSAPRSFLADALLKKVTDALREGKLDELRRRARGEVEPERLAEGSCE